MSQYSLSKLFSMASRERCISNLMKTFIPSSDKGPPPPAPTAAVLVLLCSREDVVSLLYTKRSSRLRMHSGQISFPGGKSDQGETPIQTALREAEEEIGLSPQRIDIWGQGPVMPGRDGRVFITPVIGSVRDLQRSDLKVNRDEVSEVFSVSLERLCDQRNQFHTQFQNGYVLPVFSVEEYKIWGITAYITDILLASLLPKDVYTNDWMRKKIELNSSEMY